MRNALLLTTLALFGQVAAQSATPTAYINGSSVDPIAQTGTISAISDLGFPVGKRAIQVNLNCQTPGATVQAYKPDGAGAYLEAPDPTALPVIASTKLVQTSSTTVQVKSIGGVLRMYCKDHVLYTDFSGAFGPGSRQDQLGVGDVQVRRSPSSGTIDFTYPIFSQLRKDNSGRTEIFNVYVSLGAKTLTTPRTIADIVLGYIGTDPKEGVFLFDARHNALLPLKYGGNDAGIAAVRGMPVGNLIEFYYAPDYTVNSGWRKVSIDFKRSLAWSTPTSKPANAKFGDRGGTRPPA